MSSHRLAGLGAAFLCLALIGCTRQDPGRTGDGGAEAAQRAASYLWEAQAPDGSWRSGVHGIAKGGAAWTPFVLTTLLQTPDGDAGSLEIDRYERTDRALNFLRSLVDSSGAVGRTDPFVLEYPNYATSYALRAFAVSGRADPGLLMTMRDYLLDQQWVEARGVAEDHPAFGAWGFGETNLADGSVGHVDLSHTLRVLRALDAVFGQDARVLEAKTRATHFLGLAQNEPPLDGGFHSSPVTYGVNKAGIAATPDGQRYFRSYATATCDGILALLAAGVPRDDARVLAALSWLESNNAIDHVPGIPESERGQWEDVLFFYHLNARAEVLSMLDPDDPTIDAIEALLISRQAPDGSFVNPVGGANKEDDPLIATAMALSALNHVRAARVERAMVG